MTDKIDTTLLSLRGRMGAHALHAMYDSRDLTRAAHAQSQSNLDARLAVRFNLDPEAPDYEERLKHARSYHFAQMAHKSVLAKKRKRGKRA